MNVAVAVAGLLAAALLIAGTATPVRACGYEYGPWLVGEGIYGLENTDLERVAGFGPAGNDLHYAGSGTWNAEQAKFTVNTTGAGDEDKRAVLLDGEIVDWQYAEAGLAGGQTDWDCAAGSIDDYSLTTIYMPPETEQTGIWIKAKVYDGENYNSGDEPVTLTWGTEQTSYELTAYKVGVHLSTSPGDGSYDVWEDGSPNSNALQETVTTYCSAAGYDGSDVDNDTVTGNWTLQTDPAGCSVDGNIHGSATSSAGGSHDLYARDEDWWDGGGGSLSVGVSLLLISFNYSWDMGDDEMAVISAGIGYGSDYGAEYEETGLTLVSADGDPDTAGQSINANPGGGRFNGKAGADRDGKWEAEVTARTQGSPAPAAWGGSEAECSFGVPYNPTYSLSKD